jgi:ATP-binding cassette subfamily F protein 3
LDANFLLLDEPSNHLDIPGQEVLQQVLAEFNGTILMVSHDRYLIDALASQIWEIDMETQDLEIFEGTYSEYKGIQEVVPVPVQAETSEAEEEPLPEVVETKTLSKHEQKRLQARIVALEDRILVLETQLEELGKKLQAPPEDPAKIQQLGEDYAYLETELAEVIAEWEELHQA